MKAIGLSSFLIQKIIADDSAFNTEQNTIVAAEKTVSQFKTLRAYYVKNIMDEVETPCSQGETLTRNWKILNQY